jgi:flagella basal body P-ring formation protein FlgA
MNTSCVNKYIFALLLALLLPGTAHSFVIKLYEEVAVSDRVIRLGDIAEIRSAGDSTSVWEDKEIARSPAPGEKKVITVQSIMAAVSRLPDGDAVKWQGADTVTVKREAIIIGRQEIEVIIAGFLQENLFRLPEAALRFQINRIPEQIILPTGRLEYQVIPANQKIIGSSSFSIIFSIDGKVVENCTVRGKLEAIAPVIIASNRIRKGEIITSEKLKLTEMDISRIESPYRLLRQVIGMQAKRTISGGKPLTTRNVETPPVVRRGEMVKIIAQNGRMQISSTGIAATDGRPGDSIRVKSMLSDKLIHAQVYSPGVVMVIF